MYKTAKQLINEAKKEDCKISDIILRNEIRLTQKSEAEIKNQLIDVLGIMRKSSSMGLNNKIMSVSGLTGGDACRLESYRKKGATLSGDVLVRAMARALSCCEVNASMGKIVASPTAGSCGIVPATLITACEVLDLSEECMLDGMLTASGVGQLIALNATVSGAEGGCQAECGAASSMAAAALVEMMGGTPEMVFHAAAIAIKNILGLVCDPIAGLVEAPCAKRNASGVANSMISADLALAGIKSIIPFDEVVDAMYKVGKLLPASLRETSLGGLAATPTGCRLKSKLIK